LVYNPSFLNTIKYKKKKKTQNTGRMFSFLIVNKITKVDIQILVNK